MSRRDALLAQLPPAAAAAVAKARKATTPRHKNEAMTPGRDAVGLPAVDYGKVVYPLPSELTPAQRAFLELCVLDELPHGASVPFGDALPRWLGLAPPSVLEEEVTLAGRAVPIWRALMEGVAPAKVLAALSLEKQLDLLAAYADAVWCYRVEIEPGLAWTSKGIKTLRGEGQAWARALLSSWTPPTEHTRSNGSKYTTLSIPLGATNLAFFLLARAGAEIEPEWDVLLPLDPSVPVPIVLECAKALPLDRLERAVVRGLPSVFGPVAIVHGTALVEKYDSRAIAEAVIAVTRNSTPKSRKLEWAALAEIGKRHPNVKGAVLTAMGKAPKPVVLKVLSRSQPRSAGKLTKIQSAQLVAAGKRWDGKTLPVERRLSLDENDEAAIGAVLEHVVIGDAKGKPVYEAWLYAGDSGAFFRAGTNTLVADRIQFGIQMKGKGDEALADALAGIGFSEKTTTKKAPAKKPAAKKR